VALSGGDLEKDSEIDQDLLVSGRIYAIINSIII